MKRRRVLRLAATCGVGTAAGCLSLGDDDHATIQRLGLLNDRSEPVTIDLRIERDDTDETVYEESYDVGPGLDGVIVDCVWPDEPLRVLVRNGADSEWSEYSTADKEECLIVYAEVHPYGTSFFTSNEECPARSPSCHTDVGE